MSVKPLSYQEVLPTVCARPPDRVRACMFVCERGLNEQEKESGCAKRPAMIRGVANVLRARMHMHTPIHTYIHTCIHTYIHTYIYRERASPKVLA